jgi:hypothetical protein
MCDRSHLTKRGSDHLGESDPQVILMRIINEHPNASKEELANIFQEQVKHDEEARRAVAEQTCRDLLANYGDEFADAVFAGDGDTIKKMLRAMTLERNQ